MYSQKQALVTAQLQPPKVHINADLTQPQGLVVTATLETHRGVSTSTNLQIPWPWVGWGVAGFVAGGLAAHFVNEAEQRREVALRARRRSRRRRA